MLPRRGSRGGQTEKVWQEAVLRRDGYQCRLCGATEIPNRLEWYKTQLDDGRMECGFIKHKGIALHIHHIKEYLSCTWDEAWDINNGITLCEQCHRKIRFKEKAVFSMLKELTRRKEGE